MIGLKMTFISDENQPDDCRQSCLAPTDDGQFCRISSKKSSNDMIKEVSGDILLTSAQAIAQGIAPHDHMDSGLALSLREQWPSMAKDFRHFCKLQNPEPGAAWIWGGADGKKIVNLLTQEASKTKQGHPGHATAHHVGAALKNLSKIAHDENLQSIALPRLATGVGKMDWAEVKPLIEKHLGGLGIPVFVYTTFVKGQKAAE